MNPIIVQKASGDLQNFSPEKLSRYLIRIQVPQYDIDTIIEQVTAQFNSQTVTVHDIMHKVNEELGKLKNSDLYVARYNLKHAIRKMGPEGHIFEDYVGRLYELDGYQTNVSQILHGKCVQHEVDVVARQNKNIRLIECKFHNREGTRSDVTVAMYSYARFLDIQSANRNLPFHYEPGLASNTKLTLDALRYAKCMNIHVLTVELPKGGSIMDRAISQNAYPISTLTELHPYLHQLFEHDFILLKDVEKLDEHQAKALSIPVGLVDLVREKAHNILHPDLS